jgi:hypothetical protein
MQVLGLAAFFASVFARQAGGTGWVLGCTWTGSVQLVAAGGSRGFWGSIHHPVVAGGAGLLPLLHLPSPF